MFKNKYIFYIIYFITFCFLLWGVILNNHRVIFLSLLTLFLYFGFSFFVRLFRIRISFIMSLFVYIFIFCSMVLGEILDFYSIISFWDNILHYCFGFISACFGLSMVSVFIRFCYKSKTLSLIYFVFPICFSTTIGVVWEFFEFNMDKYFNYDMQKDVYLDKINTVILNDPKSNIIVNIDNIVYTDIYTDDSVVRIHNGYLDIGLYDTILDLGIDMIGAITVGILSYFYTLFPDRFKFISKFIVKL